MKLNERIREVCHPEEAAFKIVLWQPERKAVNRGKTEDTIPFIDNLMKDVDPESVSVNQNCNNGQGGARGGTNIFLEYIFEFLVNTALLASDSIYQQNFKAKNLR